jgi:GT2 family glycosyltransferase
MSMMLSIAIVNWNTRDLLAKCLMSIEKSHGSTADLPNETIVVDNGSEDGSANLVRDEFRWAELIDNRKNVGFARACNQAIRKAKSRYVLLLNSDTEVLPGALDRLTRFMEAHPQAGACGPRLLNEDGTLQPSCYPMLTPTREFWRLLFLDRIAQKATYPMQTWDTETPRRVEAINGACLMLRRSSLDAVGLLDEDYFLYTEEVDLCLRLADADWELWWIPQARVVHQGGASSRQVRETAFLQLYRSKVQFYRKFGGEARAAEFKRYIRVAYWPRMTVAYLLAPLSATLRGRARLYRRLLSGLSEM